MFVMRQQKKIYTEQMDAEGLGRKLLLTRPGHPQKNPEKADCGYCDSSSQNAHCKQFQVLSMLALQRQAAWAEERLLGDLRQSVPKRPRPLTHNCKEDSNNYQRPPEKWAEKSGNIHNKLRRSPDMHQDI